MQIACKPSREICDGQSARFPGRGRHVGSRLSGERMADVSAAKPATNAGGLRRIDAMTLAAGLLVRSPPVAGDAGVAATGRGDTQFFIDTADPSRLWREACGWAVMLDSGDHLPARSRSLWSVQDRWSAAVDFEGVHRCSEICRGHPVQGLPVPGQPSPVRQSH